MHRKNGQNHPYFKVLVMPLALLGLALFASPSHAQVADAADAGGRFSYYVAAEAQEAFARKHPDASVGGQCGDFGAKVMGKPFFKKGGTGGLDSFRFKLTLIDPVAGTEGAPVKVGDAIVQDMKDSVGHFAVINSISKDARGRVVYVLTESNWKKDGKVTNGRAIFADDPSIRGIVRGAGDVEGRVISRYDDRLVFPAARNSAEMNAAGFIRSAIQDIATSSPDAVGPIRDATQKMLDGGELAGAVNSLLPLVTDRALSARLATSLKALQSKSATSAKTVLAAAPKNAALK